MTAFTGKFSPGRNGRNPLHGLPEMLPVLAAGLLMLTAVLVRPAAAGPPDEYYKFEKPPAEGRWYRDVRPGPNQGRLSRQRPPQGQPTEERSDLQRRWQSMPQDQKEEYRRRLERFKRLDPQDRELYRRRYQQYQKLPPQDRQRLRQQLDKWDNLSPQERDRIRQKFLNRLNPFPGMNRPAFAG